MSIRIWHVKCALEDSKKISDWGGELYFTMPNEYPHISQLWGVTAESAIKACRALGYIGISAKPRLKMWHGKWYCREIIVKPKKMEA